MGSVTIFSSQADRCIALDSISPRIPSRPSAISGSPRRMWAAKVRALEPRESLRLMGFTDEFNITVSRAQSYKQSGNSIVVDVMMAVVKNILKVMENEIDG